MLLCSNLSSQAEATMPEAETASTSSEKDKPQQKSATDATKTISVTTYGLGETEEDATKKALLSAVEQAIGTLTYSKTVITDEDAQQQINSLSNGFVETYKKLSSKKEGDLFKVQIKAEVQQGLVTDFLKKKGVATKADLKSDWAKLITGRKAKLQAIEMLNAKLLEIRQNIFKISIINLSTGHPPKGLAKPSIRESLDGDATCTFGVKLEPDLQFWKECAHPLLKSCFETLAVGKKTITPHYRSIQVSSKELSIISPRHYVLTGPPRRNGRMGLGLERFFPGVGINIAQGYITLNDQKNLYGIALEEPVGRSETKLTLYCFSKEVWDRLVCLNGQKQYIWDIQGVLELTEGSPYKTHLTCTPTKGMFGVDSMVERASPTCCYLGPWTQRIEVSTYSSIPSDGWHDWILTKKGGVSQMSEFESSAAPKILEKSGIASHEFKLTFRRNFYQPLVFKMEVDDVAKVKKIAASIHIKEIDNKKSY